MPLKQGKLSTHVQRKPTTDSLTIQEFAYCHALFAIRPSGLETCQAPKLRALSIQSTHTVVVVGSTCYYFCTTGLVRRSLNAAVWLLPVPAYPTYADTDPLQCIAHL